MTLLADIVLWITLRFVPSQQRGRYAAEFAADLASLSGAEALRPLCQAAVLEMFSWRSASRIRANVSRAM